MNERTLDFVKEVALKAGDAIRSLGTNYQVKAKQGRGNFVTDADMLSEKVIKEEVLKYFPDDQFLAEETSQHVDDALSVDYLWVVDPIDGTNNFRYQRNYSAVSIGVVHKGESSLGVVYNFATDEMYYAEKGKGAFYKGKKIEVAKQKEISDISIATDNSSDPQITRSHLLKMANMEPVPWITMRGAAALELCEVGSGKLDAFFHTHVHPWDIAAGMLVVRESGGVVKTTDGKEATILDEYIIAGNSHIVDKLIPYVQKVWE